MKILYSNTSSKGNCSVIQSSEGHLLTIDAGIQYSKVNREVGYILHQCRALLLTHHHFDHSGRVSEFSEIGMKVYGGEETALKTHLNGFYDLLRDRVQFEVDGFKVIPLSMIHTNSQDGSDCECFGFLIQDKGSGEKCLWATDTMMIPYQFPALDVYALEANYWEADDYSNSIEIEAIEKSVEMRRVRAHMSVETCASFLAKQDLSKCKEVRLLHLSNSMSKAERDGIIPFIRQQTGRSDLNVII